MTKPKTREWDVGADVYGRTVTLRCSRTYDGKEVWKIITAPSSQRDDGERIDSLSINCLRSIAEIVQKEPR